MTITINEKDRQRKNNLLKKQIMEKNPTLKTNI